MFDLEKAIVDWRRQMLGAGIQPPALDELENHLREETEQNAGNGADHQQAFAASVQSLGTPGQIVAEFKKISSPGRSRWLAWTAWVAFLVSFYLPASSGMSGFECAMAVLPWRVEFSGTVLEFFKAYIFVIHYQLLDFSNLFMLVTPVFILLFWGEERRLKRIGHWALAASIVVGLLFPISLFWQEGISVWEAGFYLWIGSFALFYWSLRVRRGELSGDESRSSEPA